MFRKKTPIFVLLAILAAGLVFLFHGDDVDQDLVRELALKQQADRRATGEERTDGDRMLTAETISRKNSV